MSSTTEQKAIRPADRYPKNLRPLSRFITDHNDEGKAIYNTSLSEDMPVQDLPDGVAHFSLVYTSSRFPVDLVAERDLNEYKSYLASPPGIIIGSGSVCRIVDMPPNTISPMHRTVSLDYGVVLEGEVELVLDSGEKRLMKRGDVAIQRGTNHAWNNVTPDYVNEKGESVGSWARMLYVLQPAEKVQIGDKILGEDQGGMQGVPESH